MQNIPQRETVVYKNVAFKGLAHQRYEKDLKQRQKDGWQLISCTESGNDFSNQPILTAIYEKASQLQPTLNIPSLPILLSMLTPQEQESFEGEVKAIVNRWLAQKASSV